LRIEPYRIEALIRGDKIENQKIEREIKAVTYHNLEIVKKNNKWEAKVLFDL
jgi:SHS2 domain-containing protein